MLTYFIDFHPYSAIFSSDFHSIVVPPIYLYWQSSPSGIGYQLCPHHIIVSTFIVSHWQLFLLGVYFLGVCILSDDMHVIFIGCLHLLGDYILLRVSKFVRTLNLIGAYIFGWICCYCASIFYWVSMFYRVSVFIVAQYSVNTDFPCSAHHQYSLLPVIASKSLKLC